MEVECMRLRTEGLKLREIGEVLDLAISSVVSYLARATKKLGAVEVGENSASQHGRTPAPV
jgi:DNA-binding CsgD family transcriptional regulator